MTLDQLRIFIAVSKLQSFTRAAEELSMTQPAVSAAIATLESRCKVNLFYRQGKRTQLTAAGKLLLQSAGRILKQVTITEQALQEISGFECRELHLGASPAITHIWLQTLLNQSMTLCPSLHLKLTMANSDQLIQSLLDGKLELGLIEGEKEYESLHRIQVGSNRLVLVVGKNHPWFNREQISIDDFVNTAWLISEPGCSMRRFFEQFLNKYGVSLQTLKIVLEAPTPLLVKAAETGYGPVIVPELLVLEEIKCGRLRNLYILEAAISPQVIYLVHNKEYRSSRVCLEFSSILKSLMNLNEIRSVESSYE